MSTPIPATVPALITGASSGIGEEFARQLAKRSHPLTLVARRRDRLEALAESLRASHCIAVDVVVADLERPKCVDDVAERLRHNGPWLLINNAGFGSHGRIHRMPAERELAQVQLNVVALHRLSLAVLPGNLLGRGGGIVNVASTAAFQPVPYMSTYAATKAFVLHFTEGLATEVAGSGCRVMALCPGPVRTEFGMVAGGPELEQTMEKIMAMGVERCVRAALHSLDRGRVVCIPGAQNHVGAVSTRLAPRAVVRRIVATAFAPRGRAD